MVNRGEELLPGVGGRVLLIEDRPEVIATVSRSLAERGYRTQTVASVADLLQLPVAPLHLDLADAVGARGSLLGSLAESVLHGGLGGGESARL